MYLFDDERRSHSSVFKTIKKKRLRKIIGIFFGVIGGLIASQTVILTETRYTHTTIGIKRCFDHVDSLRLVRTTIESSNQFTTFTPFLVVILAVTTAFMQVYCMNAGLKMTDAVVVVPVFFAFYSVFALINANVYYDRWSLYQPLQYVMILLGIAILVAGVSVISSNNRNPSGVTTPHLVSLTPEPVNGPSDIKVVNTTDSDREESPVPIAPSSPKKDTVVDVKSATNSPLPFSSADESRDTFPMSVLNSSSGAGSSSTRQNETGATSSAQQSMIKVVAGAASAASDKDHMEQDSLLLEGGSASPRNPMRSMPRRRDTQLSVESAPMDLSSSTISQSGQVSHSGHSPDTSGLFLVQRSPHDGHSDTNGL